MRAYIHTKMVIFTKVLGKVMSNMVKASSFLRSANLMKETLPKDKNMETVNIDGQTEMFIQDNSLTINGMDSVYTVGKMEVFIKDNGSISE